MIPKKEWILVEVDCYWKSHGETILYIHEFFNMLVKTVTKFNRWRIKKKHHHRKSLPALEKMWKKKNNVVESLKTLKTEKITEKPAWKIITVDYEFIKNI